MKGAYSPYGLSGFLSPIKNYETGNCGSYAPYARTSNIEACGAPFAARHFMQYARISEIQKVPQIRFDFVQIVFRQSPELSRKRMPVNASEPLKIYCGGFGKPFYMGNVIFPVTAAYLRSYRGDNGKHSGIVGLWIVEYENRTYFSGRPQIGNPYFAGLRLLPNIHPAPRSRFYLVLRRTSAFRAL